MHTNTTGVIQFIHSEEPPPWLALNGAFALIFTKGSYGIPKLVTVKRRENGMIELPGGGIDPGEESIQAMQRELSEETGFSPDGEFFFAGTFAQKVPLRDEDGKIVRDAVGKPVKLFAGSADLWLYSHLVGRQTVLNATTPDQKEVASVHLLDSSGIAQLGIQKGVMLGHLRMIAAFMVKNERHIGESRDWAKKCCTNPIEGALRDAVSWSGHVF